VLVLFFADFIVLEEVEDGHEEGKVGELGKMRI
jgi:hypothetical protein